ncbi:hypothetical protein JT358_10555 [Micrococcales bacterium 31B]|nr:hypothetical protein [Micrococcales bacterium 31B]
MTPATSHAASLPAPPQEEAPLLVTPASEAPTPDAVSLAGADALPEPQHDPAFPAVPQYSQMTSDFSAETYAREIRTFGQTDDWELLTTGVVLAGESFALPAIPQGKSYGFSWVCRSTSVVVVTSLEVPPNARSVSNKPGPCNDFDSQAQMSLPPGEAPSAATLKAYGGTAEFAYAVYAVTPTLEASEFHGTQTTTLDEERAHRNASPESVDFAAPRAKPSPEALRAFVKQLADSSVGEIVDAGTVTQGEDFTVPGVDWEAQGIQVYAVCTNVQAPGHLPETVGAAVVRDHDPTTGAQTPDCQSSLFDWYPASMYSPSFSDPATLSFVTEPGVTATFTYVVLRTAP